MSEPAVISGTFVALTPVASRKVVRLHIECPVETADHILKALGGWPDPANPKWVAVARLTSEPQAKPKPENPKERQKFSRLRPSAQAALLCAKPAFWKFLDETIPGIDVVLSEGDAAMVVRHVCQVESRSDFDHDEAAAQMWFALRDRFDAWVAAGE